MYVDELRGYVSPELNALYGVDAIVGEHPRWVSLEKGASGRVKLKVLSRVCRIQSSRKVDSEVAEGWVRKIVV